jgi:hypothetical protein
MRTRIKNRIYAKLAKRRIRLSVSPWIWERRELLQGLDMDAVNQVVPVIDVLDRQIGKMSLDLRRMCGEDPRVRLLTTICGVGYYIAHA